MTREVLHLPEPARTLLRATFETIDGTLGEIVPEGRRWRLAGETVLAARWMHRRSTDVDIFLPANSGIVALDPRWNPRFTNAMNALGASRVEVQDRSLKFSFPEGRIEVTQLDPTPDIPPAPAVVDGRDMTVCRLRLRQVGRGPFREERRVRYRSMSWSHVQRKAKRTG